MDLIEKPSSTSYKMQLQVKTNSKTQKITSNGDMFTIFLKSKPIQNRANKELINLIKNKLNIPSNQIFINSGLKSRNKTITITFNEIIKKENIVKRLLV